MTTVPIYISATGARILKENSHLYTVIRLLQLVDGAMYHQVGVLSDRDRKMIMAILMNTLSGMFYTSHNLQSTF